jgi:hypothetical protein
MEYQTDRHADRQGDVLRRYKNRGTPGTQTDRQMHDIIDGWRQTDRHADRQGDMLRRYKNRGTPGTQTDRQTDGQTDRDRQTCMQAMVEERAEEGRTEEPHAGT